MLLPDNLAGLYVNAVNVVGNTGFNQNLLRSGRGIDTADNQWRKQRVHLARFIIQLDLPQQLHVFDGAGGEEFFILLPGGTFGVTAICKPVCCKNICAAKRDRHHDDESPHASPRVESISEGLLEKIE